MFQQILDAVTPQKKKKHNIHKYALIQFKFCKTCLKEFWLVPRQNRWLPQYICPYLYLNNCIQSTKTHLFIL